LSAFERASFFITAPFGLFLCAYRVKVLLFSHFSRTKTARLPARLSNLLSAPAVFSAGNSIASLAHSKL